MKRSKPTPTLLLVGPHGVVGGAVRRRFLGHPDWALATASRRGVTPTEEKGSEHVVVDLLDAEETTTRFAGLGAVTHLVFAGYTQRPTMAQLVAPNTTMLRNTLNGFRSVGARLEHVVLIGGGKSYGEHLGPYKTPAKEADARILGPLFYNNQEDLLAQTAAETGFGWTVLRPDLVLGFAIGSPMNLLMALGVFASLSREADVPLRFPGTQGAWTALHQMTDADVLAEAVEWALMSPNAVNEVFNVTNGDNFRWQHLWGEIADVFDMPVAAPQPMNLSQQLADYGPRWQRLVHRHGLVATAYAAVAAWPFVDAVLATDYDMVQSTIKIRQAGFSSGIDTHLSVTKRFECLRAHRFFP